MSRLSLAIEQGGFGEIRDGTVGLFRPTVAHDLTGLSGNSTEIITGFHPDFQHFQDLGFQVTTEPGENYACCVVFLPRAKKLARELIAGAIVASRGGPVIVDGQKTDGVDSVLKACRSMGGMVDGVISKAHGKVFVLNGGDFSAWAADNTPTIVDGFRTKAGVFSAGGIDPGSAALIAALPDDLAGSVADLGAGWGYLSHEVLKSPRVTQCHLIEAEHLALECARQNINDPRAQFHWADAIEFQADAPYDHVVTNPPFHTGRAADPNIGRGFIAAAFRLLRPSGSLWLVANRHLPYEQNLSAAFDTVEQIGSSSAFKVFRAVKSSSKTQKTVKRRRR